MESLTLVEFARRERLKDCPVCQLPPEIRAQMTAASEKKIKRSVVLAWLRSVHHSPITDADLTVHGSGHHDAA